MKVGTDSAGNGKRLAIFARRLGSGLVVVSINRLQTCLIMFLQLLFFLHFYQVHKIHVTTAAMLQIGHLRVPVYCRYVERLLRRQLFERYIQVKYIASTGSDEQGITVLSIQVQQCYSL